MIGQSDIRGIRRTTRPASRRPRSPGFLLVDLIPELVCGSLLFVGIGLALAWLPSESKQSSDDSRESMAAPAASEGTGHDPIYDLTLLGDGRVAWCNVDRRMWTRNLAIPGPTLSVPRFQQVMRVAASTQRGRLAVGMLDGSVMIQSDRTSEPVKLGQHNGFIASLAIDATGATVASAAGDMKVRVFDVDQKKETEVIDCGDTVSRSVVLASDGRTLLIALHDKVLVWDRKSHTRRMTLETSKLDMDVCALAVSPDNRHVAVGRFDGSVDMWDLKTGELVWVDTLNEGPCLTVEFSMDGHSVLSGLFNGRLMERDAHTGERGYELEAHAGALRGIRVIDRTTFLTFGYDGHIRRWNATTGTEVATR